MNSGQSDRGDQFLKILPLRTRVHKTANNMLTANTTLPAWHEIHEIVQHCYVTKFTLDQHLRTVDRLLKL